jgi:hypothetical protein
MAAVSRYLNMRYALARLRLPFSDGGDDYFAIYHFGGKQHFIACSYPSQHSFILDRKLHRHARHLKIFDLGMLECDSACIAIDFLNFGLGRFRDGSLAAAMFGHRHLALCCGRKCKTKQCASQY